jgi:HSP20 family protein
MLPPTSRGAATQTAGYPALQVWSGQDRIALTAELPGVEIEDLEISINDDVLTLRGNKRIEEIADARYHRRERQCGEFTRTLRLPYRVQDDSVEATLRNGILSLSLPRAEEEMPRKIAVKTE